MRERGKIQAIYVSDNWTILAISGAARDLKRYSLASVDTVKPGLSSNPDNVKRVEFILSEVRILFI